MEDFDIGQNKMAESAQRVVDRAVEESRRREHSLLTNEHVFLAFAQVEWDMFAQVMRDLELNPHEILQSLEEHLRMVPAFAALAALMLVCSFTINPARTSDPFAAITNGRNEQMTTNYLLGE